jgi:uncharacterized phage protein gp47/JayE
MPDTSPPQIAYTGRDFTLIKADLEAFVQATRPDDFTDFFDSNLGVTMIDLLSYVGDLLSYGQDITAQEVFLATARRLESALRFARSVGFVPRSATSATVVVVSGTLPANVVTFGAVVRAGSFISGANGLRYSLNEDQTIVPGSSTASFTLREGQQYTETFEPSKLANQTFQVSRGVVEEDSWDVFVGDAGNPLNEWAQVDNVLFETDETQTYEVFFDGQGRLSVTFGNGIAGQIPPSTVTIVYRTTSGLAGNAGINTIRGTMQAEVVGTQTTAALSVSNAAQAATGGQDREGVAELRVSIPAFLRTLDKVTTITDYEQLVSTQAGVVLTFADVPISSLNGNVVRVHVWDTEQFTFVSTSPGQGTTTAANYQRYVQVPISRVSTVQQFLRTRTMATAHNVVIRPDMAQVDLDLGQIKFDTLNKNEDVHEGIVLAIIKLFEDSSGFLIRMSDIYAAVNDVPGVIGFTIFQVTFEHINFTDPGAGTVVDVYRTDQNISGSQGGPFNPLQDLTIPAAIERKFYDDAFLFNNEILFDSEIDSTTVQAINLRTLVFTLIAG